MAVFGESGSGKTVMLSSFYGSEQEPQNIKKGAFPDPQHAGRPAQHRPGRVLLRMVSDFEDS